MYLGLDPSVDLEKYGSDIQAAAWLYDVPEEWIKAVIQTESNGNPQAYRYEAKLNDASYGLMQLLFATAQGLGYEGAPAGLYDPHTNIMLGSQLLGQLRARIGDDFARVYSAYNSGQADLYLTSATVGANVERALNWLSQFATKAVETVGVSETAAEESAGLIVAGLAAAVLIMRKRR
jgi:soluble lytic murein transglycosylase-like protein